MTIIYSIEGNIGSGKSTLVKLLKQKFKKVEMTKIAEININKDCVNHPNDPTKKTM